MTTHAVLVAAKAYLLNHGWVQYKVQSTDGRVCLVGALHCAQFGRATEKDPSAWPAYVVLSRLLGETPAGWNDTKGRTFTEVIDVLDQAILATAPVEAPEPVTA